MSSDPGWPELLQRISQAVIDSGELADELSTEAAAARTPRVAPALGVAADDRESLIAALRRPRPYDRVEALRGLANLRDPAAVPAVVAVLDDVSEDDFVRETAARSLFAGMHGRPEEERVVGLKHAARQGLLQLGPVARPPLAEALSDPDPLLRAEACRTLCYDRADAAMAFDLVAPLVDDSDPAVRLNLATNVAQLFDPRGRDLLRALSRDAEPGVREAAAHALEVLDGA